MDHRAPRNVLKVDSVSAPIENPSRNDFLIIYNVNVPYEYLENEASTRRVLERIKNLLHRDFGDYRVVYQITASYNLVHALTGEVRVWTGSFSVRNNVPAQISDFEDFEENTFVNEALDHLEDLEEKLTRAPELSSNWVLANIISIIFNVQTIVDIHSQVLNAYYRHGQRAYRTFALPGGN
jgi:hypothetical protein